jgi:transposase
METGMSQQELHRLEVIALRRAGHISQVEAARRLKLSTRQVRRLEAKVAANGRAALRSARRGRPSNRALKAHVVSQVATIIREHYADFGPTLASEYLRERHHVALSKETVRKIMLGANLWRARRGPAARVHALRARRARFGELIQIDGSLHDWFEGRAERCCLLVFIDDATSRLTQLRFVARESTLGYLEALYDHIRQHGLPMAIYSDRHSIFRVNHGPTRDDHETQFTRALNTLGIEGVCATSPQAKGRVERVNGTLQDRLVKALRLAGINSMASANAWLPQFIGRHNRQFAVLPSDARDAHTAYSGDNAAQLKRILSRHYPRTLSASLSCQFNSTVLQVEPPASRSLRGAKVTVLEHFDGQLELCWRQRVLPFKTFTKPRRAPLELTREEVCWPTKWRSVTIPGQHHPWKTTPIGSKPLSPEFVIRS